MSLVSFAFRRVFYAFALLTVLSSASPAAADVRHDAGFWMPTTIQVSFARQLFVHLDLQARFADDWSEFQTGIVRPSIGVQITPRTAVSAGYGWIASRWPLTADEHRVWQQILMTFQAGGWTLVPRGRLEQRFLPVVEGVSWRVRGQLRALHPLTADARWQILLSNEVMVTLNSLDPAPVSGIGHNRLFTGVSRRIGPHLTLEPGYLLQFVNRPGTQLDEFDHIVQIGTAIRF